MRGAGMDEQDEYAIVWLFVKHNPDDLVYLV